MNEHYTYLLIDLLCLLFPLLLSFHPRINFHKQWKYFVLPCLATALIFAIWDILFTKMGVWSFNPRYLVGMSLAGLPLEEYLFFICIPYCCVFTYHCIVLILGHLPQNFVANIATFALIGFLTVTGAFHLSQLYTSVTFFALSALLVYVGILKRATYMDSFYTSFLIILIPFFISNGILTGSLLDEPVVSYNDKYNLGIRMITIPFEDTFYAMLLFLMNVVGFELLRKREPVSTQLPTE